MGRLEKKTIIITGGSSGIGYAIAQCCVTEGARVLIIARGKNDLEKARTQLHKVSEHEPLGYAMDVGNLNAVQEFSQWLAQQRLTPHGLVNCAGIFGAIGKTTTVDMQQFTAAIQINLLGSVYMCHAVAPLMRGGGKIVNCSGGGGTFPFPNYSAYAVSKAAIVRFTENLALELAEDNIDVNCIAPGFVATRLHEQTFAAGKAAAGNFFEKTQKELARGGVPPEKAAELTAFLLSHASDGITGKYVSAPWDPWQSADFQMKLKTDKDFGTLRRIDEQFFFKKEKAA